MIILAALGMFVFGIKTVPFQSISRSQSWKHPHQSVIGAPATAQYTGPDPEEISLSAELRPEITGGEASIGVLRQMAETGRPHTLILGSGEVAGSYVITSIQETASELNQDGSARSIAFTLDLKKVSADAVGARGQALLIAAGIVRRFAGI